MNIAPQSRPAKHYPGSAVPAPCIRFRRRTTTGISFPLITSFRESLFSADFIADIPQEKAA
jgi:hypothetical protein